VCFVALFVCCSFIFLFLENYGVRTLEAFFAVLIGVMALAFAWMFGEAKPSGKELLVGKSFVYFTNLGVRTCAKFKSYVALTVHIKGVFDIDTTTTHVITFNYFYFLKLLSVSTC
jgi:Mn2+/Fe2+ NRAMP family transporter